MAPSISFDLRTPDERFKTYLAYVAGVAQLCEAAPPEHAVAEIADSRKFKQIQGGRSVDVENVGRILRVSWFTELQLGLPQAQAEIVPYANHWAPVQVYYCAYLAARALLHVSGQSVAEDHRATLTALSELIKSRPALFLGPFSAACIGVGDADASCFHAIPHDAQLSGPSLLSDNPDPWHAYTTFLRTTRTRRLDDLADQWKAEHKKKRVPNGFRQAQASDMPATTVFDCLYRLRLRSNYGHADDVMTSAFDVNLAARYNQSLLSLTWHLLLNLELLTARYLGKSCYGRLVAQVEHMHQGSLEFSCVAERWSLIREAY